MHFISNFKKFQTLYIPKKVVSDVMNYCMLKRFDKEDENREI